MIKRCEIYSNYQLLAVVLLSDQAKVLEPSPHPGYWHPNKHKVYRVSIYDMIDDDLKFFDSNYGT